MKGEGKGKEREGERKEGKSFTSTFKPNKKLYLSHHHTTHQASSIPYQLMASLFTLLFRLYVTESFLFHFSSPPSSGLSKVIISISKTHLKLSPFFVPTA